MSSLFRKSFGIHYVMTLGVVSGRTFAAIVTSLLVGCAQTPIELAQADVVGKMMWLRTANPERDFLAAVEKQDYRFRGLYGYALVVPKVGRTCISTLVDVYPIDGTSDVVLGREHARLIALAEAYADDFNLRMRVFREKNLGFKCES